MTSDTGNVFGNLKMFYAFLIFIVHFRILRIELQISDPLFHERRNEGIGPEENPPDGVRRFAIPSNELSERLNEIHQPNVEFDLHACL